MLSEWVRLIKLAGSTKCVCVPYVSLVNSSILLLVCTFTLE